MSINRIANLNISGKHLFSGIFGRGVEDLFIDDDLRKYGIYEALYRDLKRQGYTVVFYSHNTKLNFFSYRKEDLARLYNLMPREGVSASAPVADRRYVAQINSPFANRRRARQQATPPPAPSPEEPDYDQIQTKNSNEHTLYRIADSVDPFMTVTNYIDDNPQSKIAFIFATGISDNFSEAQTENIDSMFEHLRVTFASRNIQARIIVIYDCGTSTQIFGDYADTYFTNKHFRNRFLDANASGSEDGSGSPSYDLYEIPGADAAEFRNMLNRRRILEGLDLFSLPIGLEEASVRMCQQSIKCNAKEKKKNPYTEQMSHYINLPAESIRDMIEKFDTEKAIDRLRAMDGMETVITQLLNYIDTLKESRDNDSGPRFRPHLVFSGNPGTGKTTVARLLADILREERLLEKGHLIEATVGDLEGQYIGETRIKTQALCDKARGGVLFIDEAYGLMSGASAHGEHVDYGKEAIEVLIQFMENSSDSLVILGGYRAEMENLIQNGNQGFMRRFNGKESFIQFDDYSPEALYAIFRRQIKGRETTPEFDTLVKNIINYQHAHRTLRWGNAGEMEKLASSIISHKRRNKSPGPLSPADIPDNFTRIVAPTVAIDDILKEVEALDGLENVKQKLRHLVKSAMGQRKRALRNTEAAAEKKNLNFIFTGAPGTGKTTVANLMARILFTAGLIDKSDEAVIVQKGDIVKSGVGDTPKAIKQLFTDHAGEVIFIDEAYGLAQHGSEAIDEITNCLTDRRFMGNQAVILAGYTHEMDEMLRTNRGLRSRFENIWLFEDFTNEELWSIFKKRAAAAKMTIAEEDTCRKLADAFFDSQRRELGPEFSNARKANQLYDSVAANYDTREFEDDVTDMTIRPIDFPNAALLAGSDMGGMATSGANHITPSAHAEVSAQAPVELDLSADSEENRVTDASHFAKAVGLLNGSSGMGTAFIISKENRLILTACHVVEGSCGLSFSLDRGAFASTARVVWSDPLTDMAILRLDELPADARYFAIDHNSNAEPPLLQPIIHCGYVRGLSVSDNFQVYEGKISGYDPQKQVNPSARFDAILSDIAAINGCSGGPVMRKDDLAVIGILQGGFEGAPTRIISDIHQLHKHNNITIIR